MNQKLKVFAKDFVRKGEIDGSRWNMKVPY